MPKETPVPRPTRTSEYVLKFATTQAQKGWRDLVATRRNSMSDTWDFLTRTPQAKTPTNYPLEGSLAVVTRGGQTFERWQHKPTLKGGARVWFYVDSNTVYLEQVHTAHPNETK
jgi:hypothetical protein